MNLILFERQQARYQLPPDDPRRDHIRRVLQMRPGDRLYIGAVNGPRALGVIAHDDDLSGMTLEPAWEPEPPRPSPIALLVGLPRPQTARRVLFESACQGAAAVHFFQADKGEPSYRQSRLWISGEWQRHLREGAEQAFTTNLPEVVHHSNLAKVLEHLNQTEGVRALERLALDVYEGTGAASRVMAEVAPAGWLLAIGPEGGWTAPERTTLRHHGFTLAHLGERVLRTETAVTAAMTLARAALGQV